MKKRLSQGQIKAFLEQCSFLLVIWASCSYNREARHFNSVEPGCRLGSAGALGGGWWGLTRVLLPLIFICPAHGAGSPPNLEGSTEEGHDGKLTVLVSPSLCGSRQDDSWLSWLFEKVRGHHGMALCPLHCQFRSCCRRSPRWCSATVWMSILPRFPLIKEPSLGWNWISIYSLLSSLHLVVLSVTLLCEVGTCE